MTILITRSISSDLSTCFGSELLATTCLRIDFRTSENTAHRLCWLTEEDLWQKDDYSRLYSP